MQPVVLSTDRLVLSVPTADDVDAIHAACQDADIQRFTTVPSPYERMHAEEFIPRVAEEWKGDTARTWAIRIRDRDRDRDRSQLAGMIGLYRIENGAAEIGYWVAAGSRGRGVLTEAARAVIDWGFAVDGLGLQRIEWRAVVGNTASARGAQRLGFRYEGLLRLGLHSPRGRDDGWVAGLVSTDDRVPRSWSLTGANAATA